MKAEAATSVRIFVEISKTQHKKLEFDHEQVTGKEIKEAAGVALEMDLGARQHGQLELVTNEETITIKDGDHFVALPAGSIS